MIVNRLENRLAVVQALEMELEDVEIVAIGMQSRDGSPRSLVAVVLVIVVTAHVGDSLRPEQVHQAFGERRLARGAVADDAGDDRSACGHGDSFALPSLAGVGSSAKMLLFRMSCGSIVISSSRVSRPPRSNRRLA